MWARGEAEPVWKGGGPGTAGTGRGGRGTADLETVLSNARTSAGRGRQAAWRERCPKVDGVPWCARVPRCGLAHPDGLGLGPSSFLGHFRFPFTLSAVSTSTVTHPRAQ